MARRKGLIREWVKNMFDDERKECKVDIVIGLQFGDEGKAKIVDYLNENYDIGVRFNGSSNAGHTCVVNGEKTVFHLLPAMALRKKICVLSPGVLIEPFSLEKEIKDLNIDINNIRIDYRCPIILPIHISTDQNNVHYKDKIGTTGRGNGPCMKDHVSREGSRYHSLFLGNIKPNLILPEPIDTRKYLYDEIKKGKKVLFEGAQGYGLDLNFGTYPYVTSTSTTSGAVCSLAGIPYNMIGKVYGVFKAYCTRVGNGPFKTEIKKELEKISNKIQKIGNEFGSTTGRPRRIGWLDVSFLKESCEVNGVTDLVMTKADVLDEKLMGKNGLIRVYYGEEPCSIRGVTRGWKFYASGLWGDLSKVKNKKGLPDSFKELLDDIETYCNVPITMVSLSPERENIILL